MHIEIKGVNFRNKGAELMLNAIVQKLSETIPDAKLVVTPSVDTFLERSNLKLFQKLSFDIKGIDAGLVIDRFVHPKLKNMFGIVSEKEIDVVLDASGLAYSDQWGNRATKTAAHQFKRMKKHGTKIILLPQAIGPLRTHKIQNYFRMLCENADLICARDRISYNHALSLCNNEEKIYQYPDFTNLVKGETPENIKSIRDKICVIPNYRMIDKVDNSEKYLPLMIDFIKHLRDNNREVFILIHSGDEDLRLANKLNGHFKNEIMIHNESDPLKIKGIIGNSKGVISSRFHGLVSALSQGIPALGTGWNHKYEMLFKDYNFEDGLLRLESDPDELKEKLIWLTEEAKFNHLQQQLAERAINESRKTKEMWELVWQKIL